MQRLLIERVIRIRLQLDAFEAKLALNDWTPHDSRTYGGLQNAYRLGLRELGLASAVPRKRSIAEYLAEAEATDAPP